MEIIFLVNGKTEEAYLQEGISLFEKRIQRYITYKVVVIPSLKNTRNMSFAVQMEKEAELMLPYLNKADRVVLLDEKGKHYSSVVFADFLQKQMNRGCKTLMFVVGGPYGFSDTIRAKAQASVSLSCMTFSHQMIRLLFTEQIYRAFSILHNEPYHNS